MIFAGRRGRNVFYLNRTGFAATGEKMKKRRSEVGSRTGRTGTENVRCFEKEIKGAFHETEGETA